MAIATRLGTAQKLNSSATIAPVHNTVVLYCSSTLKVMLLRTSRCPSNFDSSGRRAQSKCRCKTAMYKAVYKAYIAYIYVLKIRGHNIVKTPTFNHLPIKAYDRALG